MVYFRFRIVRNAAMPMMQTTAAIRAVSVVMDGACVVVVVSVGADVTSSGCICCDADGDSVTVTYVSADEA